jgi:hypothetical protein
MNFDASTPGGIGLLQLVHVTNVIAPAFSVIVDIPGDGFVIAGLAYILYASQLYYSRISPVLKRDVFGS